MKSVTNLSSLKRQLKRELQTYKGFVKVYRPFEWSKFRYAQWLVVDLVTEKYRIEKTADGWKVNVLDNNTGENEFKTGNEVCNYLKQKLETVYREIINSV
ncbi:MAG: hypothetical protein Q4G63_07680 [Bacteroidia bacterium]|nr:hypothetical protein [Bacteroidia bacterium]